jgi:rRNA-processing protein FCF1
MLLRNGVSLGQAIRSVQQLAEDCERIKADLRSGGDPWRTYLEWSVRCEQQFRTLFPDPALIEGLHTDRYWQIWTPGAHWGKLIDAEIDAQVVRLNTLVGSLRGHLVLRERPGHLAVLDTNVLLHYQRIDQVDWGKVVRESPVRLVVPHVVLDELDDKRYLGSDKIREKARSAVVPFDERREQLEGQGYAKLPRGDATVEYLVDEEDHTRRDNPDEEIIDRARFLQQVTARKVTVITADRGMRARAVSRGLQVAEMPATLARDQESASRT